jgi:hypothetical protein
MVLVSPWLGSKLLHACFGVGRFQTRVGEVFTEAGYKVDTGMF